MKWFMSWFTLVSVSFAAPTDTVVGIALSGIHRNTVQPSTAVASPGFSLAVSGGRQDDWTRVTSLPPGAEIQITVVNESPEKVTLIATEQDAVTFVSVASADLSRVLKAAILEAAAASPKDFLRAQAGATVRLENGVRLSPDGLFADQRRIGPLDLVLRTIPRDQIVRVTSKRLGHDVLKGAVIGSLPGLIIALVAAAGCTGDCDAGGRGHLFLGYLISLGGLGALIGALIGAAGSKDELLYQAP